MTGKNSELTLKTGEILAGDFKDGKLDGRGSIEYPGGMKRKEGQF